MHEITTFFVEIILNGVLSMGRQSIWYVDGNDIYASQEMSSDAE